MRTERKGLFVSPLSFARLPVSQDFQHADIAILGLPFDCGSHPTRLGARLGPNAIREQSVLSLELIEDAHNDPLQRQTVIDAGDVNFSGGGLSAIGEFYARTEHAITTILDNNCTPVSLGGDGAVFLPQIRSVHQKFPDVTVLHFDAHTDCYPLRSNEHFDNATPFTHAANEGVLDIANSVHVGTRAPVNADKSIAFTEQMGYRVLPWTKLAHMPVEQASTLIRSSLEGRPVYLCFDMDFFDPSAAPGVATPTPGGPTTFEGLNLLRAMKGLNIVACDINTVSPPYDINGITAQLAASIVLECVSLIDAR
ncbi:arginase family protein [Sneathiella sp.]|jgi:agmatinase|uniref:arginase family protein n=1 Tax=Sneathiella sp. TaxID=1964365 RepID=UPI0039E5C436